MPRPPVKAFMELLMASSAWRSASLTAPTTRSCSISTSSGSTTSGFSTRAVSSFLPLTVACTAPPPTLAVKVWLSTLSWALAISSCIFMMRCCIICCFIIWPWPPPKPPLALYPFAIVILLLS